jgi:hypothetical protein
MINLANRRQRTRRCLHRLFQRGTKVEQVLAAQRGQAGLKSVPGITRHFGFNLVFDGAYRIRKSFTSSANEIGRLFLARGVAVIGINTDNRPRHA